MAATTIRSEVDLDAEGRRLGYLRVPHSSHRSACGWIPIPIASIRRGAGPTVLAMASHHGDAYEGQVIAALRGAAASRETPHGFLVLGIPMGFHKDGAEAIEQRVGIPVTGANHAPCWHALRLAGIDGPTGGVGRLFRSSLPAGSAGQVGRAV